MKGVTAALDTRVSDDVRATREASNVRLEVYGFGASAASVSVRAPSITAENAPEGSGPTGLVATLETAPVMFCRASSWWLPSPLAFAVPRMFKAVNQVRRVVIIKQLCQSLAITSGL